MKHLRKFEELQYSTYMKAADKMQSYGQTGKSEVMRKHAKDISRKEIDEMTFGILVGNVKEFPNDKLQTARLFKSASSWVLQAIFNSNENTHSITCSVSNKGEITWSSGNKFINRKSVAKFQHLVLLLANYQPDFLTFLKDNNLKSEDLKLVSRTFYI
jgi:hypothetical protein